MKNILFATSEAVPFYQDRRFWQMQRALCQNNFDKRYFDIRVILPKYACMKQEWKDKMDYITHFYMDLGYKNCYVGIMHMEYEGIQFYFIDNEYYFSGPKTIRWRNLGSGEICILLKSSIVRSPGYRVQTGYHSLP